MPAAVDTSPVPGRPNAPLPDPTVGDRPVRGTGPALDFGPGGYLYATHPLHAFAARCPPPLVEWAVRTYSRRGEVVLDPMVGSGTTLVEAALLGRRARGVDIDPLARLVAAAKATPVDPGDWDAAATAVGGLARAPDADDGWRPALPGLDRWFRPEAAAGLARLRTAIRRCGADGPTERLLWACLSSLVVARTSVANARDLVHSRHHYRAWPHDPGVLERFEARARQVRRLLADYRRRLAAAGALPPDVAVVGDDARAVPLPSGSVDLVCTSPPYCSALDYTRAHVFAVAWLPEVLGLGPQEYRRLGRSYVGSERAPLAGAGEAAPPPLGCPPADAAVASLAADRRRAWIVHRYFRDMRAVVDECARVTRPGGHVVLVVCPSNIRKVSIPTHSILAAMAAAGGRLDLCALHERRLHDHRRVMPYLETAFGARMRTEYVVVLRRNHREGAPGDG